MYTGFTCLFKMSVKYKNRKLMWPALAGRHINSVWSHLLDLDACDKDALLTLEHITHCHVTHYHYMGFPYIIINQPAWQNKQL